MEHPWFVVCYWYHSCMLVRKEIASHLQKPIMPTLNNDLEPPLPTHPFTFEFLHTQSLPPFRWTRTIGTFLIYAVHGSSLNAFYVNCKIISQFMSSLSLLTNGLRPFSKFLLFLSSRKQLIEKGQDENSGLFTAISQQCACVEKCYVLVIFSHRVFYLTYH